MAKKRTKRSSKTSKRRPRSASRGVVRALVRLALTGCLLLVVVVPVGYLVIASTLPDVFTIEDYQASAITHAKVFDSHGVLIAEIVQERRTLIPLDEVTPALEAAVIAAEDSKFYTHDGVDPVGILRAAWKNLKNLSVTHGGSTITQQVAKTFYLSPERTLWRKLKEAVLAVELESQLSKKEILYLYLNQIYFGHGRYGVEEASMYYFGTHAAHLTVAEAATLAGIIKGPELYSPRKHPKKAKARRDQVLALMADQGFISESECASWQATPLEVVPIPSPHLGCAPYAVDAAKATLAGIVGSEALATKGYEITLTIDCELQAKAEAALTAGLVPPPKATPGTPPPQGAMVVVDGESGAVVALVGGADHGVSPFNRAVTAKRQVGSTIKPLIAAAALGEGLVDWETTFDNEPLTLKGHGGTPWTVSANGGSLIGEEVTLTEALVHSLNVVAVELLMETGISTVASYATSVGLDGADFPKDLTIALGSVSASPLQMACAYVPFSNGGVFHPCHVVEAVVARDGTSPWPPSKGGSQLMDPGDADALHDTLVEAVEEGTGWRAGVSNVEVAGKTGTTNGATDAWFVGFSGPLVGAVWVGYDTPTPMPGASGGTTAAPIFGALLADLWGGANGAADVAGGE